MKKYGIGRRGLTLLLVLAMIVSMAPNTWAAVGDIATGTAVGSTGLTGDINTQDTISWPIKIYDYLNDGMLFEYPNASDTYDIEDDLGGAYGGGTPAPQFGGAVSVIGNDYTVSSTYTETAYTGNFASSAYWYSGSKVEAKNFVDPMHLRVIWDTEYTKSPVLLSNFGADNKVFYEKTAVRYVVIAYRTNGLSDSTITLNWKLSDGSTSYDGSAQTFKASSDWTYKVYDMKTGAINTNWSSISGTVIDEVRFDFPLTDGISSDTYSAVPSNYSGQYIDISHIAYFDTEFEAIEFGKDAVAFDKDPGEFLDRHTEYPEGEVVEISKPSTDGNGMDFSVSDETTGGYKVDTYQGWTTAKTGLSYIGTVNGVGVTEVDNGERSYVQVSNKNNSKNRGIYLWDWYQGGDMRYVTIVYKTTNFTGDDKISFFVRTSSGGGANLYTEGISSVADDAKITLKKSENEWIYVTYAFSQIDKGDSDYVAGTYYTQYGLYLPACMTGQDRSLDIAFVQLWSESDYDSSFGQQAADYMNGKTEVRSEPYTTTQKKWNTGNNVAFSMLYANQGGGWQEDGTSRGGENKNANGYYSYQIGQTYAPDYTDTIEANEQRDVAKNTYNYPVSDTIYLLNDGNFTDDFQTNSLDMGGYNLFNTFSKGVYTAGLLNSSLVSVTAQNGKTYRVPDYKEATVEYIALLLQQALCVGQTDTSGNYNYNFVKGTANGEQYGYDDNGKALDLASALRKQLGIKLPANGGNCTSGYVSMGDYATMTDADKAALIGEFSQCKGNINTFVEAAYYLLMNLYVSDSYNQAQDEYSYLVLSQGTVTLSGKSAYVFDGGFTTGIASNTTNTAEYRASSESAVVYDKELGTISLKSGLSKDQVYFDSDTSAGSKTTRFPFLPVTDATGVYAGETKSPYFLDDGRGVMGVTEEGATFVNRNYNFAMASNGEFAYRYDEGLFFEFEGDDDVYLFINGQLVLDIGGAHSVTNVTLNVNDYVDWARKVKAGVQTYNGKTYENLSATEKARVDALNLKDGEKYTFDFYYMERHGWGSNCRIATNIVVTDPALDTVKRAYQGTDVNGESVEVGYGGIVDVTKPVGYSFDITNDGETKLYKLSFMDADIGLNLTYDGGLLVYGRPTVQEVTTTNATSLAITGLNGIVSVDGTQYAVYADGTVTWTQVTEDAQGNTTSENKTANAIPITAGTHTLVMYQMYRATDAGNCVFTDATVTITGDTTTTATVAGIRVTDKDGGVLNVSDLIVTVDGYASEEDFNAGKAMDTISVSLETEQELMEFLRILQDPEHNTGETDSDEPYAGDGLWLNATIKISGFYYTLTKQEQEENVFSNTVYTYGYNRKNGTAPIKSQARQRVYGLGEFEYYQWASNTVHLDRATLWTDIVTAAQTASDSLYEQLDQVTALNKAGVSTLTMEVTDRSGEPLSDTYNLYANGVWGTYNGTNKPTATDSSKHIIYFKNTYGWDPNNVRVYYWSDTNTSMTTWPGEKMQTITDNGTLYHYFELPADAENVVFNNGFGSGTNQTGDIALPETAYTAVNWNSTNKALEVTFNTTGRHIFYVKISSSTSGVMDYVIAPVVFYVADVENRTFVLDYGLSTETITSSQLLKGDDFLADYGMTYAKFIGYCTNDENPEYLGTYSAANVTNKNLNRVSFTPVSLKSETTGKSLAAEDGTIYIGSDAASDGTTVNYVNGTYSLPDEYTLSFTPNKIMDNEYSMWMAFVVCANGKTYSPLGAKNASGATNPKSIDIHYETQMLKKVTFLPATVVYYEDDFADINYNTSDKLKPGTTTDAAFAHYGEGSGSLTQGIDATTPYGHDSTYQTPVNAEVSGNSITTVKVTNNDTLASFDFKGTGFEIIGRTNSYDSASLIVTVKDASGVVKKTIPVITEFTNVCEHETHGVDGKCTNCGAVTGHSYPVDENGKFVTDDNGDYVCEICDSVYAPEVDYYLIGSINGEDCGNGDDWQNLTPYRFIDGKLTVKFDKPSYIGVKALTGYTESTGEDGQTVKSPNFNWYWTSEYCSQDTAIFYLNNPQKMYVPSGVELTFTLVENDDGSLTVSYDYTKSDAVTLYFDSPYGENVTPKIYAWTGTTVHSEAYPGTSMNHVDGNIWSYTISGNAVNVLFNDGGDQKTADLVVPADGNVLYQGTAWVDPATADIEVPENPTGDTTANEQTKANANSIYQVPVLRVDGLDYGTYTVEIAGMPTYDFPADFDYDKNWDDTTNSLKQEVLDKYLKTTYFYLDGVRVYLPLTNTHDDYYQDEDIVTYDELRDLILDGNAAVAVYEKNKQAEAGTTSIYVGNSSWTENRNGNVSNGEYLVEYTGNQVGSIDEYLLVGPNNEAYMYGDGKNQAVIFYVTEEKGSTYHTLQIGARAIDVGLFNGAESTGANATLYQGVASGGSYAWQLLETIKSSTEQYYVIDYTKCPSSTVNGVTTYQVALYVGSGMISFSNVKTVGLDLVKGIVGEESVYLYSNGIAVSTRHTWDNGKVTTEPTCTTDGVKTYTCTEDGCGKTKDEVIPATGHNYVNGVCTSCGQAEPAYYLFGYINGANYACEGDYENMGEYKFVDGKLTVKFDVDSYIGVKTTNNGAWYMAQSYVSTKTGTFYNTTTGANEKMLIPSDKEYILILTVGEDDTLTIRCVDANCEHSYTSEVTTAAGCESEGVQTYTCSKCGDTYTETIAGTGHSYTSQVTTAATCTGDGVNTFTCGNCGSSYTESIPATGHSYSNGTCTSCGESDPNYVELSKTYYLFGYINGANYACEGDYENMGEYKLDGNSLTTTFESDSYVAVKSEGNDGWFMTDGWLGNETTTATLYNTSTGIVADKLYVPGGVEVTFKLVENDDGTLTLSYTITATETALNHYSISRQMSATVLPEEDTTETVTPSITLAYPALAFEDEVFYNIYFSASDLDVAADSMGLILFDSLLEDGTVDDAVEIIPGAVSADGLYRVRSTGVSAKNLGDTVYFKVYARLSDGSYVYSKVASYSAQTYAKSILSTGSDEMKALVVAMLNFGAAAQKYFGYKTDSLVNDFLSAEQTTLVNAYETAMLADTTGTDTGKLGSFAATNGGFIKKYPSIAFESAFAINYYFTPDHAVDGDMVLYYWNEADYASADVLTVDNATGSKVMTAGNEYNGAVTGIAAKEIDDTVYVAAVYTSNGTTYCSGVLAYSLGAYCKSLATGTGAMADFARATAVYGYYAEQYFAN